MAISVGYSKSTANTFSKRFQNECVCTIRGYSKIDFKNVLENVSKNVLNEL